MTYSKEQCWRTLDGNCLEVAPDGYYGFIYMIVDDTGKFYVGKKAFSHSRKVKLSKKARVGTRKRVAIKKIDSKWLNYWGSCVPLLEYIKNRGNTVGFKRFILKFTLDKQSTTYWETAYLITHNVLFQDNCWNGHILSRFFKNKIHK